MGVFWPVDSFSHAARLTALVGIAAGCCALADRDTRYAILRYLYNQLKSLDEAAARDIETKDSAKQKSLLYPPRDTRSYASDSTAFSRASSPVPSADRTQNELYEKDLVTQPSSAMCNTPEAVDQLGEALKRWKNTQSATSYTPSPLSKAPSMQASQDLNYNLSLHNNAVTVASDELLLPLTTAAGPQTPSSEATPMPAPEHVSGSIKQKYLENIKNATSDEPKPKVIDASKRLSPLPNPNAPKIKPTDRDGRPQPCDYLPPLPNNGPSKPVIDNPVTKMRRERGHVQIETTDHDSYGFVSNPSALVPPLPPPSAAATAATTQNGSLADSAVAAASAGAAGDHYLFVCIKCHRQSTNEVCEKICSDEDGVLRCRLRPRNGQVLDDMEDLVLPMTPKMYVDGRRKTTGRMLFENLQALHTQHERMKARSACGAGPNHSHGTASRECPNAVKSRLRIVPVNCLSMCHLGNVIAVSGPGKFGYQFGAMHESDSEDLQAILQFAEDYIENPEGFTKNKTRPPRLSRNILARIPPALPTFTSIAE
ncbi:hypothetical protein J3B02_002396 [Coemansia erecta]|uniref:Uncharacterized protein n=1 Tax=Coemansia asiatica TaxID=1052880 RepID=A0A9W8CKF8_9FUNG|nr:hypothetical protein LPJ64_002527 [Coemansia asiatica]KAJ2854987.1 hypothetical protein J3B02_002396 [Coemansia erecta]KAJ2887365.1 hypothetical protein FB639_001377 [Coemansia asiatica]